MLKTLDSALLVLDQFTQKTPVWGVRDLARHLHMSHTAVNRILVTFEKHGFLHQDPESKKYLLGLKMLEFSSLIQRNFDVIDNLKPLLKQVRDEVQESVFLTWREHTEGVTLYVAETQQQIKLSVTVGARTPLYIGASCKVIFAYLGEEQQREILKKFTEASEVDTELATQLQEIRESGICLTRGEFDQHTFGVAFALFGANGEVVGSVTVAGPRYRLNEEKQERITRVLQTIQEEANAIAASQNY